MKKLTIIRGSSTESYEYTYDSGLNQTSKKSVVNSVQKGTTTYSYDRLNRLEKVVEPGGQTTVYTFDGAGNRETEAVKNGNLQAVTGYKYDEQNRLTGTEKAEANGRKVSVQYTYDSNGNMTGKTIETTGLANPSVPSEPTFGIFVIGQPNVNPRIEEIVAGTSKYEYNVWNQLVRSLGQDTVQYRYDGDGYRIEKKTGSQTTRYVYEGDKVVLELDGQTQVQARQLYGIHLAARKLSGTTVYYGYNGHGDVTSLPDGSGILRTLYEYDAFGNPMESATKYYDATGAATSQAGRIDSPIRYAGYQFDSETGLYYLNARYYEAGIARFMSEDTYRGDPRDPLSLNLYTYVHNELIKYDDPTGHFINLAAAAVGALAGGLIGAGIEIAKDIGKGQFSKSNWKNYAGAAAAGAIMGGTAGLTGGASLLVASASYATAGYGASTAQQYISTGKVNHKEAAKSAAISAIAPGAQKATNSLKSSAVGGGASKPAAKSVASKPAQAAKKPVAAPAANAKGNTKGTGEAYNRSKHSGNTPSKKAREETLKRDNNTCQYCGSKVKLGVLR